MSPFHPTFPRYHTCELNCLASYRTFYEMNNSERFQSMPPEAEEISSQHLPELLAHKFLDKENDCFK